MQGKERNYTEKLFLSFELSDRSRGNLLQKARETLDLQFFHL